MKIRSPHVAGYFYPSDEEELTSFLEAHLPREAVEDAYSIVSPHAGYIYSGKTAAKTIGRVRITDTVLLLGPNHTGLGRPFSIMPEGCWQTPLGDVPIDEAFAKDCLASSKYLEEDELAHLQEHALEVQLPFLKHQNANVSIVPITIGLHDFDALDNLADQITGVLEKRPALILSSSDMTHYESAKSAEEKDKLAIDAILKLDEKELRAVVTERQISMCGFLPTYLTLQISKKLGATQAKLIEYCNSGDTSGDYDRVVGYAGIVIG